MTATRPRAPFRYWGSKVRMAPWIVDRLPPHDHYIEGCAGSAAVLAVKPPVLAETLNDTYGEVVNFFRVLRDPERCAELIDLVAFTPYSREEFIAAGNPPADAGPVARAWSFFVRMQMAIVPGRSGWCYTINGAAAAKAHKPGRWSTMPDLLKVTSARFADVAVEHLDLIDLIDRYDAPGVLIFVDPPYTDESRPASTGPSSAYVDDQFDHAGFLNAVASARHARFAISHYPDPLYDGAEMHVLGDYQSHRNSPNGTGRDVMVERLYLSRQPGESAPPAAHGSLF